MKKILILFALIALFAPNVSAADGDVFEADVTHKDLNGKKTQITMRFLVESEKSKRVSISGYKNEDGNWHNCIVADYENTPGEIIVPKTVNGYSVFAVGEYAFSNCVAKVTLPESILYIRSCAFSDYQYDGYDFQVPRKVTQIGELAFYQAKLKGMSLGSANLHIIGDYAFESSSLETLIIPKGVSYIGVGITANCDKLSTLAVENGNDVYYTPSGSNVIMCNEERLLTVGDWDLLSSNSPRYPRDYYVVVYYIWKTLWAGCNNSRIPENTQRIKEYAFEFIDFSNPTLIIPKNVLYIGDGAFECSNIKHLIIRTESMKINELAFWGCTLMERIDFYGGNVTIGKKAFKDCTALKEIWCYDHKPKILASEEQFENVGPNWSPFKGQTKIFSIGYTDEFTDEFDGENIWKRWFYSKIYGVGDNPNEITSIYLADYTWPLAGENADFTATSLTDHATVKSIQYKSGTKIIDPSPYDVGDTLDIAFTITLDDGYTFADDVQFFVNGRKNDAFVNRSTTERAFIIQDCAVSTPPGGMPINTLSLSVEEPVEGQPLSTRVTSPTGRFYDRANWVIDSVVWKGGNLDSYAPNDSYTLTAYLHAKTDYTFSPDINAQLNNKTAAVTHGTTDEGVPTLALSVHYGLQVYTVFDSDNNTLTYYYDGNMDSRTGAKEEYDQANNPCAIRFKDYSEKVVKAVIDPSMKEAPLTSTAWMFYGGMDPETNNLYILKNMTEIEGLKNLNTKNVTDMSMMFRNCSSLKSIDVSSFNTANVMYMDMMFNECTSLTSLDLTSFNIGNVQNVDAMFRNCSSLTTIYCNKDWSKDKVSMNIFLGCTALEGGKGTKCDNSVIDNTYARPDGGEEAPGYFTTLAVKGDANGDFKINTADVVAVYDFIEKGAASGFIREACDVNGDDAVNTADVVAIYSIIINGTSE